MAPPQWAYQVENFVTEPDEELICSICRAVFCDPTLCPCDHVFCKICITKWLQSNRNCPICRKRVSNSSIKQTVPIVKNLIMKLMINCHNKSLGCKAQFSLESSETHMKECEFEFVQCKNKPCKDKLFRKDIIEHETKDCLHRSIQCPKCFQKMPTSSVGKKHNCVKALLMTIQKKNNLINKKRSRIRQLEDEIKKLKEMQNTRRSNLSSVNTNNLSGISPDEITINIHEFDSQSSNSSSDSDISSDSFYIFADDSIPDDNEESDSFSAYMDNDDNESNHDNDNRNASEYRNAESQTIEIDPLSLRFNRDDMSHGRDGNLAYENDSTIVEVPNSVFGEVGDSTQRRSAKRRPTTEKPAKRKHHPALLSSSSEDDDNEEIMKHLSSRPPKDNQQSTSVDTSVATETNDGDFNSYTEAGPSTASTSVRSSRVAASNDSRSKNHSRSRSNRSQKRAKQVGSFNKDNAVSSRVDVPFVFQRTLSKLERYNLESDPEWFPEYASHRGNDTTTESDSSCSVESSDSELSDVDSLDGFQHEPPAISDFMNWMFDSTSDEDPDWRPPENSFEDDAEDVLPDDAFNRK